VRVVVVPVVPAMKVAVTSVAVVPAAVTGLGGGRELMVGIRVRVGVQIGIIPVPIKVVIESSLDGAIE
jgi:hypothetical protein